jgi:hypothetical protein
LEPADGQAEQSVNDKRRFFLFFAYGNGNRPMKNGRRNLGEVAHVRQNPFHATLYYSSTSDK